MREKPGLGAGSRRQGEALMSRRTFFTSVPGLSCCLCCLLLIVAVRPSMADGYDEVLQRGTLRHLGVPYARFVTGSGDGLDVELAKLFAGHLGVRYEYVQTDWENVIADLVGNEITPAEQDISVGRPVAVRGDVIANGFTFLPWRQKIVEYSVPTFPSAVWLVVRADFPADPIVPSGDLEADIRATIALAQGAEILAIAGGCLDPALNRLRGSDIDVTLMPDTMNLNELIPVILHNEADGTLIDVPDALLGIQKWPGQVKVLGPLSAPQQMGFAFTKSSGRLRDEFNTFFLHYVKTGKYQRLVEKYYPSILTYYPEFFAEQKRLSRKQ